jgi:hypothetical protein
MHAGISGESEGRVGAIAEPIATTIKREARIPWYLWCSALAVLSVEIGGQWDLSWHESIGRDTFWTPPHIAIYLCGVLAGIVCGYLILYTTMIRRPPELMNRSVQVLGFSAPIGAFLAAWGGVAMLTSAPFDNWWHSAYGLDVKIVSPPHALLMLGILAIKVGSLLLVISAMNRAEGDHRMFVRLQLLALFFSASVLKAVMFFCTEYTWDVMLHTATPYIVVSAGVPFCFAAAWKASGLRWAATGIASIYTAIIIALILILPLFPAQPKLGPVYQPVTHFIPPQFPLLIIAPAFLLDVLWSRAGKLNSVLLALVSGPLFLAGLLAVEWPFAGFLMTPAANNRFFATGFYPYQVPPWSPMVLRIFVRSGNSELLMKGMAIAVVCAIISVLLGFGAGTWIRKVQR